MASSLSEDLTCSICLCIFNDPVIISCGHSFCRKCITASLSSQPQCPQCPQCPRCPRCPQCPQCRANVPKDGTCFITNQALKGLVQKAKEAGYDPEDAGCFCPEHQEKLKLFCVTDQQLVCLICRDAEKHENHQFKPIKEAAASLREDYETFVRDISKRNLSVEKNSHTQRGEITTTKEKTRQLTGQISKEFEEMHRFLRRREDELKEELKLKEDEEVKKLNESLNALETALSEGKELQDKVKSHLEITDPERFLKTCTENKSTMTAVRSFNPEEPDLQALQSSLSMGPYESHLQFFVWKQMLQVIPSRAEQLSFTSQDLQVSADGRCLLPACQKCKDAQSKLYQYNYQRDQTHTAYSSGFLLYGEIEVGTRDFWEIQVGCHVLKLNKGWYTVSGQNGSKTIDFKARLKTIGIYQNHDLKEFSFYDADNMKLIHSFNQEKEMFPSVSVKIYNRTDEVPVRICCYQGSY